MFAWLQKQLVEKWLGRLVTIALAALAGWLSKYLPADLVAHWADHTAEILMTALPLIIAAILDWIQHRVALKTMPPVK